QSAPNTRTLCHQYGPKQSPGVPRRPDKEAAVTNKQPVPDAILELGLAFWASKALLSAVELGLFTTLAHGPLTAETLTAKLGLQQRGTTDWLDALVCLGMLSRSSDGEYANTPATGLFLDRAKPSYLGGMLEMANARLYPFWGSLTEGLRTGRPQNEAKTGGDFFAALHPEQELPPPIPHTITPPGKGPPPPSAEQVLRCGQQPDLAICAPAGT